MKEYVTLHLEDDTVRFTPNGRIAVIDAIGALSEAECAACIWEDLKRSNPHISEVCGDYNFSEEEKVPVTDSEGWMMIQMLLLEHLIESEPSRPLTQTLAGRRTSSSVATQKQHNRELRNSLL